MWKQSTMAKIVPIRFTDEVYARYEVMASQAFPTPLPVSTYLKQRLAAGDGATDAVMALRHAIDNLADHRVDQANVDASPGDTSRMLREMLLLLRALAGHQHQRSVHGELKRQGVTAWESPP
jgi:hypothetical protein